MQRRSRSLRIESRWCASDRCGFSSGHGFALFYFFDVVFFRFSLGSSAISNNNSPSAATGSSRQQHVATRSKCIRRVDVQARPLPKPSSLPRRPENCAAPRRTKDRLTTLNSYRIENGRRRFTVWLTHYGVPQSSSRCVFCDDVLLFRVSPDFQIHLASRLPCAEGCTVAIFSIL